CRNRYIATGLNCTEQAVQEAIEYIRTLNPKPGSVFSEGDETRYIVPDVIVEIVDDQYVVMGNDSRIPQLTISPFYQQMLKNSSTDEQLTTFVKNKIEKAFWLIRSIEQRRLTLYKVSQQIVDIQRPFLDHGIKRLKPLTLKEVALNVGVHESTVSRATANKYIQTPRGLFSLKFFFSSGLSGTGGDDYSSHSIKSYIRELVDAEDSDKPLSDQHLAELLQERGINISRRTVAKYREEISIPASYKRRQS
ncbi:MAG: RNA polymerase factor sigma-54, partial [Dethiobacteria bacterium]|nr:RNA polymerase factor sigma-54 [Dethiobacteria bacterium]